MIAAIVLVLPVLYLAGEASLHPDFWRYSARRWGLILGGLALYAGWLGSYRLDVPLAIARVRTGVVSAVFSLLVALVATEVVLRVMDPLPTVQQDVDRDGGRHLDDPDVGHVYRPNHRQVVRTPEWTQAWRSNAEGVRADRDLGPKPEGVYRILIAGDSFTVGDQVAVDSTYPGVIQRLMDERYGPGRVQVVNAGFPGYGTVHVARWIEKFGPRFDPDLVLVGATPNDLLENGDPLAVRARDGQLVRARVSEEQLARVEERQRWYSLPGLLRRTQLWKKLQQIPFVPGTRASRPYVHRRAFMTRPDAEAVRQWERAQAYMLDARQAAAGLGAEFGFITIPFRAQFADLGPGLDPSRFGDRWGDFADEQGIPFLDLFPAFRAHPEPRSLYWVEDGHCNAAGYALIGRETFEFLVDAAARVGLPSPSTERSRVDGS